MYLDRLNNLKKLIEKEKVGGVLVSSVANITYLIGYANFSKEERDCYLLVSQKEQMLVTHSLLALELKGIDHGFKVMELTARSKFKNIFLSFIKRHSIKKLGIEEEDLRVSEFKRFSGFFKNLVGINLEELRILKEEDEEEKIKKACEIGDLAFENVLQKLKVGVSEKEIAWELEKFVRGEGAELSFRSIVAFGKNSAIPHHQTDLMDFGVKYKNYCSDMTRTVIYGSASKKQKEIYEVVKGAQEKAVGFVRLHSGSAVSDENKKIKIIKLADVDKAAREFILKSGYSSIPHSLGHGIGIEVHERPHVSPRSSEILEKGMVFSIEPGIYLPAGRHGIEDFGGVRIEDLFYFDGKSLVELTHSKKELIELK
ncbi:MAG: Peptidase M24 [Candidatus Daviesbacteria bacterium GW2011_GWB1_36_5]|uniref:Peptidase M24 n=1 Tax=Candidatus Daviesbacteria bacterium GW2011_GWB1_36_5 TaxID=1618426 RepID=A0A0G0ESU8_9BACT|nr:MAG: Peptidase M24 [Candidatus Daviesbacteria bacterium GW2011_GWB1_36_5]